MLFLKCLKADRQCGNNKCKKSNIVGTGGLTLIARGLTLFVRI